jgi:hypothetical protein
VNDEARYRLPRTVLPRRYDLVLKPDLEQATFEVTEDCLLNTSPSPRDVVE